MVAGGDGAGLNGVQGVLQALLGLGGHGVSAGLGLVGNGRLLSQGLDGHVQQMVAPGLAGGLVVDLVLGIEGVVHRK